MFVCSYTQTTFLTQAESENINAQHDGVALPREKEETRKRATTKTGEGDSAPYKHAVAARPSTRPAGAASTQALQADSPPPTYHTSKRTHNKQHQKITLDAKGSRKD